MKLRNFIFIIFELVNSTTLNGCCELYVIKKQYTNSTGSTCTMNLDYLCFFYGDTTGVTADIQELFDYDYFVCAPQDQALSDSCIPSPRATTTFSDDIPYYRFLKYSKKSQMWILDLYPPSSNQIDPILQWENPISGIEICKNLVFASVKILKSEFNFTISPISD